MGAQPAAAQRRADIVESLTAEFAIEFSKQDAGRTRDLLVADDHRRLIEEEHGQVVSALSDRIRTLRGQIRALTQVGDPARAEAESLRSALVWAHKFFNDAIASRDAESKAAIEAYRAAIERTIARSTSEEIEAYARFVDGDDSAFATITRLARASIAARNAATVAANVLN